MSDSCYPLTPVESSTIDAIGHNGLGRLIIRFKTGSEYAYDDVEPETHAALMAADSKGGYFAKHIKGRLKRYPCEKLQDGSRQDRAYHLMTEQEAAAQQTRFWGHHTIFEAGLHIRQLSPTVQYYALELHAEPHYDLRLMSREACDAFFDLFTQAGKKLAKAAPTHPDIADQPVEDGNDLVRWG